VYEPHLLQEQAYHNLLGRLDKLSPSSQAQWGKMNAAQMLAHVAANLEMAMNDKKMTQTFMGRIFGSMAKRQVFNKGMPKNAPTAPHLKISNSRDFQKEKEALQHRLEQFVKDGETGLTKQPHPFFGLLTPNEWAHLQYVHVDHHLKQFGA
jgi:Protein of unknown function (DUF1569)